MSTRPNHHRAKHRGRIRRFALPATVVCGLTLVAHLSLPYESALLSTARAQGPTPAPRKVQPKIVDFGKLAKQKAEARRLMDLARKAAANGDLDAARRHADQAAAVPVEWNLGEKSPKKFLAELATDPTYLTESLDDSASSDSPSATRLPVEIISSPSTVPEVIELDLPKGRSGARKQTDPDDSLEEKPTTTKSLRALGFKAADDESEEDSVESDVTSAKPLSVSKFASIPTAEELSEPASSSKSSGSITVKQPTHSDHSNAQIKSESPLIQQLSNNNTSIPTGRMEETTSSSAPFAGLRSQTHSQDAVPTTTTVIHEFRLAERTATPDQAANASSSIASQLLLNLNSLMMAGLFGALVLLVGVAVAVLRKFGPNPQFTFKVELNQPLGFAAAAASTVAVAAAPVAVEPVLKPSAPPIHVTPIYALKRQMEEEFGQQQEDAMMRQVFEDNLKLREQIEETRIAA